MRNFWMSFACGAFLVFISTGCGGSGIKLEDVSGTATFEGAPIAFGQLEFIPDSSKGQQGPAGEAEITGGKFDTKLGGKGVVAGHYRVRVTAYESRPEVSTDETVPSTVLPIFLGYTIDMEVKGGELNVDVPADARGTSIFEEASGQQGNIP